MDSVTVICPSELDIAHAAAFRAQLLVVEAGGAVTIDAAAVTRVDGSGLQLLAAFVQKMRAEGRSWSWRSPTPCLVAAAEMLALADHLGLNGSGE